MAVAIALAALAIALLVTYHLIAIVIAPVFANAIDG
jgi:hypothetical protein